MTPARRACTRGGTIAHRRRSTSSLTSVCDLCVQVHVLAHIPDTPQHATTLPMHNTVCREPGSGPQRDAVLSVHPSISFPAHRCWLVHALPGDGARPRRAHHVELPPLWHTHARRPRGDCPGGSHVVTHVHSKRSESLPALPPCLGASSETADASSWSIDASTPLSLERPHHCKILPTPPAPAPLHPPSLPPTIRELACACPRASQQRRQQRIGSASDDAMLRAAARPPAPVQPLPCTTCCRYSPKADLVLQPTLPISSNLAPELVTLVRETHVVEARP